MRSLAFKPLDIQFVSTQNALQKTDFIAIQRKRRLQMQFLDKIQWEPRSGPFNWLRTAVDAFIASIFIFWTLYFICTVTGITDETKAAEICRSERYLYGLLKCNKVIDKWIGEKFFITILNFDIYRVKNKVNKFGYPFCELEFKAIIENKETKAKGTLTVKLIRKDYNTIIDEIPLIYYLRPTGKWFPEFVEFQGEHYKDVETIYDFREEFRNKGYSIRKLFKLKKRQDKENNKEKTSLKFEILQKISNFKLSENMGDTKTNMIEELINEEDGIDDEYYQENKNNPVVFDKGFS